ILHHVHFDPRNLLSFPTRRSSDLARGLHCDTLHHSLGEVLHLDSADEAELYQAMDWLLPQQPRIEQAFAKLHLSQGGLVLYDLRSEEHTSELQSLRHLVCRLLLEK